MSGEQGVGVGGDGDGDGERRHGRAVGGDIREHVAVTLPIINTMCRYLNVMAEAGRLRAELV